MSITDLLTKKPKNQIALTAQGRAKIEKIDPNGSEGRVLWYIKEHGQCSLQEIADDTGFSYWKIKAICEKLANPKGEFRWLEWV